MMFAALVEARNPSDESGQVKIVCCAKRIKGRVATTVRRGRRYCYARYMRLGRSLRLF